MRGIRSELIAGGTAILMGAIGLITLAGTAAPAKPEVGGIGSSLRA
jgi:hypothetical protein